MSEAQSETAIGLAARVTSQQRLAYKITPQANALLSCAGLGGQLTALAKVIKSLGKEDGLKVHALIGGISMDTDGAITFEIVTVPEVKA